MSYLSPYTCSRYSSPYYRSSYYPHSYLDYPYYSRSYYNDYPLPLTRTVDVVTTTTTTEVPVYTPSYHYPRSYYYPSYRYYSPYAERSYPYLTTYIWASLWWFQDSKSYLFGLVRSDETSQVILTLGITFTQWLFVI